MENAKLPELIAKIEALGLNYARASWADDAEQELLAADEFLYEVTHLRDMLDDMSLADEISREPTSAELHAVHQRLYDLVMQGDWHGTEDALKALLFELLPQIQA